MQVLITVLVNGGGTYHLLKRWKLQGDDEPRHSFEMMPMLSNRGSDTSAAASQAEHMFQPDTPLASSTGAFAAVQVNSRFALPWFSWRCILFQHVPGEPAGK